MEPYEYYTLDLLKARRINEPPRYLFYFQSAREAWFHLHPERPDINELQNSIFGLRTTENPRTAGPFVFVLDSDCLLDLGFTLYPFTLQSRDAQWRVIDADRYTKFVGDPFFPNVIYNRRHGLRSIPFTCVSTVGVYLQDSNLKKKDVGDVKKAALVHGFELQPFKWEEWWTENGPIPRTDE